MSFGPPQTLDQLSGQPQVSDAFLNWTSSITLVTIKGEIVNGLNVDQVKKERTFQGVIQPLSIKQLMLLPEGERAWQWYMIHCQNGALDLNVNDKIEYRSKVYKVMKFNDYTLNGYVEYHVVEDYQNEE